MGVDAVITRRDELFACQAVDDVQPHSEPKPAPAPTPAGEQQQAEHDRRALRERTGPRHDAPFRRGEEGEGEVGGLSEGYTTFLRIIASTKRNTIHQRMNLVGSHFQKYYDMENAVKILKWSSETSGGHIFVKKVF